MGFCTVKMFSARGRKPRARRPRSGMQLNRSGPGRGDVFRRAFAVREIGCALLGGIPEFHPLAPCGKLSIRSFGRIFAPIRTYSRLELTAGKVSVSSLWAAPGVCPSPALLTFALSDANWDAMNSESERTRNAGWTGCRGAFGPSTGCNALRHE